jgi:hypothetical protein
MPGGRLRSFRLGDRNELIAEFVLSTFAFTTRVPRQEDVGHDLLCVLSNLKGDMFWAGPSFTVQVKSNCEPLIFEKDHEIAWLDGLDNPFLVVVVSRQDQRVEIYSTWVRLNGILRGGARRIVLVLGNHDAQYEDVTTEEDGSEQRIPLGRPIISTTPTEVIDEKRAEELRLVLQDWVWLDRENIVRRHAGMYWVLGPKSYETNMHVDPGKFGGFFYSNPQNLLTCQQNFGRTATALRVVLRRALGEEGERKEPYASMLKDLEQTLRSHVICLDSFAIKVLNEVVGLNLPVKG